MKSYLVGSRAVAALTVIQMGFAAPVSAQSDEAIEAARRINISGRQRMLSQRISKAACFLNTGPETTGASRQLADAVALFETSLQALLQGDENIGIGPEKNQPVREALLGVEKDWEAFTAHLQPALENGNVAPQALAVIDKSGLQLLTDMNRTVNKTAHVYGDVLPDMPLILALTIDLAGRQRMFTQKAAKEFCLIDKGVDVEENRARLAKTTQYFTFTLGALQDGMPGTVMAAPNDQIRGQLEKVLNAWTGPKAALESAAAGNPITDAQRNVIAKDMEQVLVLMNKAVGMYEKAIPAPE